MAKINRFDCDLCGAPLANGREHSITIVYPYAKDQMDKDYRERMNRRRRKIELCEACFAEHLPEFRMEEGER